MNIKNNARKKQSISRIKAAFLKQLEHKDLSRISVSGICADAGINRSSFYAHFLDVYDLADRTRADLEKTVNRIFENAADLNRSEDQLLYLFKHVRQNQELYRFYFKLGYDDSHCPILYTQDNVEPAQRELMEYRVAFFMNGLNALLKKWLDNGCAESPEELQALLLHEYRGRAFG